MIRRPPRSTLSSSSAASDVYKRQDGGSGRKAPTHGFFSGLWRNCSQTSGRASTGRRSSVGCYYYFLCYSHGLDCYPRAMPQFSNSIKQNKQKQAPRLMMMSFTTRPLGPDWLLCNQTGPINPRMDFSIPNREISLYRQVYLCTVFKVQNCSQRDSNTGHLVCKAPLIPLSPKKPLSVGVLVVERVEKNS